MDTNLASSIHDVVTAEVGETEDLARLRLLCPSSSVCSNCFSSIIIPTMETVVKVPYLIKMESLGLQLSIVKHVKKFCNCNFVIV